ncbi:MAG: alternative ribosome rescue aminoacyl-tRNA hydrolase ArfB [Acidimicrobiia bacterium]
MDGEALWLAGHCEVPLSDLDWKASGPGGPGGQHANTSNTRVEVRLDLVASRTLCEEHRAQLIEAFGPLVRVVASDERSQARNRQLALERLRSRLAAALEVPVERRPTAPTRSSRRRRVDDKRRRGDLKRGRSRPEQEE